MKFDRFMCRDRNLADQVYGVTEEAGRGQRRDYVCHGLRAEQDSLCVSSHQVDGNNVTLGCEKLLMTTT